MNSINHIVINGERVELPTEWRVLAKDLGMTGDDMRLLEYHFDGAKCLNGDLKAIKGKLDTKWYKLSDTKLSSKARIKGGKIQYITCSGRPVTAAIKQRSSRDTHNNYYLCFANKYYQHRLAAFLVAKEQGFKGFYNDFDMRVHHRLIDETGTENGNQLEKLTVLSDPDHKRLHKLLNKIAAEVKKGIVQTRLL